MKSVYFKKVIVLKNDQDGIAIIDAGTIDAGIIDAELLMLIFWCQSLLMPVTIDAHEAFLMPVTFDARHYWCPGSSFEASLSHVWCQSLLMPVTIDAGPF